MDVEMLAEYDFTKGERCKYAKASESGNNIVRLDPDVAEVFRDSKQVNELHPSIALLIKKQS